MGTPYCRLIHGLARKDRKQTAKTELYDRIQGTIDLSDSDLRNVRAELREWPVIWIDGLMTQD
jgi:hypothetical protein